MVYAIKRIGEQYGLSAVLVTHVAKNTADRAVNQKATSIVANVRSFENNTILLIHLRSPIITPSWPGVGAWGAGRKSVPNVPP